MIQPPVRTICSAPFRHLATRLAPVLKGMEEGNPLRPRRVLVISNLLRDHLQILLARQNPLAGVSFLTLEQFARDTGESSLLKKGLRPLPPLGGPGIMEVVLRELRPRLVSLCPPEGIRGYGLALYETWKDIVEARLGSQDLRALSAKFPRSDALHLVDIAQIVQLFENRLDHHRYFDQPHLISKACEILEENPDGVPTVLYGFSDMNPLQKRLALAACAGNASAAFVPADPNAPACAFAQPFIRWLDSEGFVPDEDFSWRAEGPLENIGGRLFGAGGAVSDSEDAIRVVSAPTTSREAFELCREIYIEKEKLVPSDSAGILLPSRKYYGPLFQEILRGMKIPVMNPDAETLANSPSGRTYLRMLSLKSGDYTRSEVVRFLDGSGIFKTPNFQECLGNGSIDFQLVNPTSWEYRSRDLPYLSGEDGWRREIDRALAKFPGDFALRSLDVAMDILFGQMNALPQFAFPSEHIQKSLQAFRFMTVDLEGSDEVDGTIRSLAGLDEILGEIPVEEFLVWARLALEDAPIHSERVPARVHILTFQQARGLSFETVAIPGLSEGVFPSRGTQDPILPDALRERLNRQIAKSGADLMKRLSLKAVRSAEERFLFWTAIQAAKRRVILGYPTGGNGGEEEKGRPPSLFLEYTREAAGSLRERTAGSALEPDVLRQRAITVQEFELSEMLEQLHGKQTKGALGHLTRGKPGFFRRLNAWRDRWGRDVLTPFDGAFCDSDLIESIREKSDPEKKPVSVTALEAFFSCPYRFALSHLLRLGEKDEPERALEVAPDLRGNLYHETIKRFAEEVRNRGKGFGELAAEERRELIARSAESAFWAFEKEVPPPAPVAWRILRETIERDLNIFFRNAYEGGPGWRPVEMEGEFGQDNNPQSAPAGEAGAVLIRGRYDLVERDRDGHCRFVDFKSGRYENPGIAGGANLQGDLYAHHGRERFGPDVSVGAAYAFVSERGGYRLAEIPPDLIEERRDAVGTLLGFYLRALESGVFFPAPSAACRYCDFIFVCGPDRDGRTDRKMGAPLWKALNELREKTK